jgi:hypothetical protein
VALAERRDRFIRPCSSTLPGLDKAPMPDGSPSRHVLPSPPPPPSHPSSSSPPTGPPISQVCWQHFETHVTPCTPAMDQAEAALASALVAVVDGTRSSPAQVVQLLVQHYSIMADDVQVKRYSRADFLLIFTSRKLADQVPHIPPPLSADFHLIFQW